MLSMPGKGMRPRVTLKPAWVSAELSAPARARLRVIHGAWAVFHARKRVGCCGREGRREEMHAGAAFAGVEAEADGGVGVVGKGGALVEVEGGVGLARGDDLNAASGEQGTEADVEGEVGGLFELAAVEVSTGVVAPMGGVEEDDEAGCGWGGGGGSGGDCGGSGRLLRGKRE